MPALTGQALVDELHSRIASATHRLWIASPYLGSWDDVRKVLGANWSKVDMKLLVDKDSGCVSSDTLAKFAAQGPIRSLSGLHAKLYVIDDAVLLTSANLTGYAFSRRHEIGMIIESGSSRDLVAKFEGFWEQGTVISAEDIEKIKKSNGSGDDSNGSPLPVLWTLPPDSWPATSDPHTYRNFSAEELAELSAIRADLGSTPLRKEVKKWFQQNRGLEFARPWIVKNRYIVTKNPEGPGAICILDPTQMPECPFPRVRKSKSGSTPDDD